MVNMKDEHNHQCKGNLPIDPQGGAYEMHIKGHLDESWSDWLEGMEVELLDNGEMILSGVIVDQAAFLALSGFGPIFFISSKNSEIS